MEAAIAKTAGGAVHESQGARDAAEQTNEGIQLQREATAPLAATVAVQPSTVMGADSTMEQVDGSMDEESRLMQVLAHAKREQQRELAALLSLKAATESSARQDMEAYMQLLYAPREDSAEMARFKEEIGALLAHRPVSGIESQFRSNLESLLISARHMHDSSKTCSTLQSSTSSNSSS
ncbi:unnamed protein product [Closterium sp. Naga37s-1]|nr:unnamed protein product [Closterium sp. Naga37s-1]